MEKDFCKKCGKCCKQIYVDFDKKLLYFDGILPLKTDFAEMLIPIDEKDGITICKCKFLSNNLCTNKQKPKICLEFPSSPFAFIPDSCGFYGEIFIKKEAEKQKIRKLKEEIVHYESLLKITTNKRECQQYEKILKVLNSKVEKYSAYGSRDW